MASAFPQFAQQRSLVLAMARGSRPPPRGAGSAFLTIRGGLSRFADALAEDSGADIRCSSPVITLQRNAGGFAVAIATGEELHADGVVVATTATTAADLLTGVAPAAARAVRGVRYHDSAVVLLRFEPEAIRRPLDASGYLVAPENRAAVAACTFLNAKWPHVDWTGTWMRATVTTPAELDRTDDELAAAVAAEVVSAVEASAPPDEIRIHRWSDSLPVYSPGHRNRMNAAKATLPPRLALAGAAYQGFGIPDCIASCEAAAETCFQAQT